jgi:hypothetical protein
VFAGYLCSWSPRRRRRRRRRYRSNCLIQLLTKGDWRRRSKSRSQRSLWLIPYVCDEWKCVGGQQSLINAYTSLLRPFFFLSQSRSTRTLWLIPCVCDESKCVDGQQVLIDAHTSLPRLFFSFLSQSRFTRSLCLIPCVCDEWKCVGRQQALIDAHTSLLRPLFFSSPRKHPWFQDKHGKTVSSFWLTFVLEGANPESRWRSSRVPYIPRSWQSYCGSIIIRYVSKIPSYCTDDADDDDDEEERRSFSRFGGPEETKWQRKLIRIPRNRSPSFTDKD